MEDDVRKMIYLILVLFILTIIGYISFIYISGCGFTLSCPQGQPLVVRTPIPSLIPATMPAPERNRAQIGPKCQIAAVDLIGAWVNAGYPENDKFPFTDVKETPCEGTFKQDVQPLFTESNLWFPGAQSCSTCHHPDLATAFKNMDLSSYQGILAGSNRVNGEAKGTDILGGGNWDEALMHQMLFAPNGQTLIGRPAMPFGRPPDVPANGPLVFAGAPAEGAAPAGTPGDATPTAGTPVDNTPAGTLPPVQGTATPTATP
jgi:hypothetical protein